MTLLLTGHPTLQNSRNHHQIDMPQYTLKFQISLTSQKVSCPKKKGKTQLRQRKRKIKFCEKRKKCHISHRYSTVYTKISNLGISLTRSFLSKKKGKTQLDSEKSRKKEENEIVDTVTHNIQHTFCAE